MPEMSHVRSPRWLGFAFAGLVLAIGGSVAAWSVELPYYAMSAGPTGDVIDSVIADDGLEVFLPGGEMMMLTVALQEVNAFELAAAVFDPTVDLVRRELFRREDETDEEYRERGLVQMDQSKENAIALAIDRVGGLAITSDGVEVVEVSADAPAADVLQVGDAIVAVEGTPVDIAQQIGEILAGFAPGDAVELKIERAGESMYVSVELTAADDGRPLIGILASTLNPQYPIDIESSNVGGPSAGMMYTLGIIDLLTPGDLTHGNVVAGTGTIAADGTVGAIGGIRQKVVAAEAAGARYVLVPEANYDVALGAPVESIEIVAVATIDDALHYLETLPAT
jgi:PDZ domain-containing protein